MALRTEGVGRGVNWQGLSNLANIIQRGGETRAEIFRGIGENITKRRQFAQSQAQERQMARERMDFDMAALTARLAEDRAARAQSANQFQMQEERYRASEAAAVEDRRMAAEDRRQRTAIEQELLKLRQAESDVESGVNSNNPMMIEQGRAALKMILPQMMGAMKQVQGAYGAGSGAYGAMKSAASSIEGAVDALEAPPSSFRATTPSVSVANDMRSLRESLMSSSLTDDDARNILGQAAMSRNDARKRVNDIENELRRLRIEKRTPRVSRAIDTLQMELAGAQFDLNYTTSEYSAFDRTVKANTLAAEKSRIEHRNNALRENASPDMIPFIESVISDPTSNGLDYTEIMSAAGTRMSREQEPLRRIQAQIQSASEAIMEQTKSAVFSGADPKDRKDASTKFRFALQKGNIDRNYVVAIAASPNRFGSTYALGALDALEKEYPNQYDWNAARAALGSDWGVLQLISGEVNPSDLEAYKRSRMPRQQKRTTVSDDDFTSVVGERPGSNGNA